MRWHVDALNGFRALSRRQSWLALLLSALLLSACGTGGNPADDGQLLKSDKERISEPQVTPDQIADLAEGNNAFALDFYKRMCQDSDGNVFVSPYSISLALAMTFGGGWILNDETRNTGPVFAPYARQTHWSARPEGPQGMRP